jgi:hypothetical protein
MPVSQAAAQSAKSAIRSRQSTVPGQAEKGADNARTCGLAMNLKRAAGARSF